MASAVYETEISLRDTGATHWERGQFIGFIAQLVEHRTGTCIAGRSRARIPLKP